MDPRAKCLDAVSRPHRVRLSPISRCCGRVVRIEALLQLRLATMVGHPQIPNIGWPGCVASCSRVLPLVDEDASRSSANCHR